MNARVVQVHDFHERLDYSQAQKDDAFWERIYREAFPNFHAMQDCQQDMDCQRIGIDRKVRLTNGHVLKIDEKNRDRTDSGDILLEYLSVDTTGALGWVEKDLRIDYLAYAFMKSLRAYLLPFPLLRRAWLEYGDIWRDFGQRKVNRFMLVPARNRTYTTWSVAVPTGILLDALKNASLADGTDNIFSRKI